MSAEKSQSNPVETRARSRRFAPLGIIFGLLGLLLFIYFVSSAGLGQILAGIQRLGAGFLLILAISSLRYVARAWAWTRCVEAPYRLPFRDAFAARLMGDALGNIIPFVSVAVSEPSKGVFVKDKVPLMVGLPALAIENIFYAMSVALFIFAGTTTLLLSFTLPKALRYASIGTVCVTLVIVPLLYLLVRTQARFLSGFFRFLARRGIATKLMTRMGPRASVLEDRVYGFYERNQGRFLSIFLLDCCFHAAGVLEVYVTLSFISPVGPTLTQAFILESVNRIINVAFKFVPLRAGVDEGGTGQVSKVLGFARDIGVTLAIVRKGRDIFWSAIGVALIWKRGLSLRNLSDEAVADLPQPVTASE
ncbi:MAG TPA: lysylphosphatidylglycerol synthase domain-containing protein [Pyrinomonadaceae bacterium]|nr:lysylphosphatidylglycerol synthase domain-containing protein [Pyrinomonadaceae bacterium]